MKRTIQTGTVRHHELSDRAVACPNARDYDKQTSYGVKAKTGMWITYRESDNMLRSGRVLGRVDAPYIPHDKYPCPRIDGYVSVLALADNMQYAYIRWIDPSDVAEVSTHPPAKLLAWITGTLPDAVMVHHLANYGTLAETYIDHVDHHVTAWKAGVSPAAWDAGVRSPEPRQTMESDESDGNDNVSGL